MGGRRPRNFPKLPQQTSGRQGSGGTPGRRPTPPCYNKRAGSSLRAGTPGLELRGPQRGKQRETASPTSPSPAAGAMEPRVRVMHKGKNLSCKQKSHQRLPPKRQPEQLVPTRSPGSICAAGPACSRGGAAPRVSRRGGLQDRGAGRAAGPPPQCGPGPAATAAAPGPGATQKRPPAPPPPPTDLGLPRRVPVASW